MIIAEITSGRREAEKVTRGQFDVVHTKALLPLVLALDVRGHGQFVVLVAHGHVRVEVLVAERRFAARYHRVCAVSVVVILQTSVVHHGGYIRMRMVVRSVVVAVCVAEYSQALEVVFAAEYRPEYAPLLGVPHGEAIAEQVLALAFHRELKLYLPVGYFDGHRVPDGAL